MTFSPRAICAAAALTTLTSLGSIAAADGHAKAWTLDADTSQVAFGSIKKDSLGEAHSFDSISGTVSATGAVEILINLASVNTNIDIRNERMIEHVFKNVATATLAAELDMADIASMAVGDSTVMEIDATLSMVGNDVDLYGDMFIARLAEDKVMVTTDKMIFLDTEEAGIDAGISKLMELAELPSITRAAPVTLRLMFNADG